jgi:nucleotide-binding universal stress UspA family protein
MKTILVGYEERPLAGRVLERAAELAKLTGANVVVTSVAHVMHGKGGGPIDPTDPPERHETELREAAAQLAALGIEHVTTVVGIGDPAHAILQAAEENGADLIVVGAHDGGAFSRIFSGSVGDTVAHKAHADVLIVH